MMQLDGPGTGSPYEPGPNTTKLPDKPLSLDDVMGKLRAVFDLPADGEPSQATPEVDVVTPAAEKSRRPTVRVVVK